MSSNSLVITQQVTQLFISSPGPQGASGGGGSTLDSLSDVTITTPQSAQALRYNGSAWVNARMSLTDLIEQDELTVDNSFLVWDAADGWQARELGALQWNAASITTGTLDNARLPTQPTFSQVTLSDGGGLVLAELATNGASTITHKAAASLSASITYYWPVAASFQQQFTRRLLSTTDATGELSWWDMPAKFNFDRQYDETSTTTPDGSTTVFSYGFPGGTFRDIVPGSTVVYLNGLRQRPSVDYTIDESAHEITFTNAPQVDDWVSVDYNYDNQYF